MKLTLFSGFLTFSALTVSVGFVCSIPSRRIMEPFRLEFVFLSFAIFELTGSFCLFASFCIMTFETKLNKMYRLSKDKPSVSARRKPALVSRNSTSKPRMTLSAALATSTP